VAFEVRVMHARRATDIGDRMAHGSPTRNWRCEPPGAERDDGGGALKSQLSSSCPRKRMIPASTSSKCSAFRGVDARMEPGMTSDGDNRDA
jgi:hypothetical protein